MLLDKSRSEGPRRGNRPPLDLPSVLRLAELGDYVIPFAIRAISDLGVADLLIDGPLPVVEIADRAGAHPGALLRTLRALASRQIFTETEPEVFGLTPLAQPLRSDHPLSLRDSHALLPADVQAWARLGETLRTGEPAFERAHGRTYWDHLSTHPDDSERVDRWMDSVNRLHLRTVVPAYPWGEHRTLVDVGGGDGAFAAGLLRRCPELRITLFDLPHVVARAPRLMAEAGVADRCTVVAGSFLADDLPAGADAYVLKTVLPGFPDEQAGQILRRVRAAMRPDSRLVLLEAVLPGGDTPDVAKLYDVHMMVLTAGAHRSVEQTTRLLAAAGLRLDGVSRTSTLTVLRSVPA